MNYIAEIKAFYDRLELNPLPSPAIVLWHGLMHIANKTGWQQEFTVASSVLSLKTGLNASALKRARNTLAQEGLIKWRSRTGNQSALYKINSLVVQNNIKYEPQYEPQTSPQPEPQCEPQSEPINKHKHKQNNMSVNTCVRFEEFWSIYPKQTSRYLAEQAYALLISSTESLTEDGLITAANNYADACRIQKTQKQFIKNPANWINENIWIDYMPENYKPPVANQPKPQGKPSGNKFNNFEQRKYDFAELERKLSGIGG